VKPIARIFPKKKKEIICSRFFLLWLFIDYYNYYLFVHVMYQNMQLIAEYVYLWWLSFVFIKGFFIERSVWKNEVLICPFTVTAFIVQYHTWLCGQHSVFETGSLFSSINVRLRRTPQFWCSVWYRLFLITNQMHRLFKFILL